VLSNGTGGGVDYDSGDGLHPNAAGSIFMAQLIKNAIDALRI
jgi:lysophospholipase L1-like esterase